MRAETESAKAPVDFATLQLHNLMYEKNHYLKAIKACNDFKTKYPDIDLVPEEEFFGSAPDEIKGKVLASDAAHDLMLKRLNFELLQVCFASCTLLGALMVVRVVVLGERCGWECSIFIYLCCMSGSTL